jgi:CarboxypepD_reg-like domain
MQIRRFFLVLISFLFFGIPIFGQDLCQGFIINKLTREKIPFVTISLLNDNRGTNADDQGMFHLCINKLNNDTLIVSSVGYKYLKIPVRNLPLNMVLELEEKRNILPEVIIGKKSIMSSLILNEFSQCGNNYYTTSGVITQMAQHFQAPIENSQLSEINICKLGDNSLFRIRIYSMDSINKIPSEDIADTIIEVKSSKRHVHINLEKFNIVIPKKDFFIAIEWIKIPYNERKEKSNMYGNGTTISYQYSPFLCYRDRKIANFTDSDNTVEVLQKGYNNRWMRLSLKKSRALLISAKIKY